MNTAYWILAATWVLIAALLIVQPWLARKNVLFGVVFGNDSIWHDDAVKRMRAHYLFVMIAGTVILSAAGILYLLLTKPSENDLLIAYFIGIAALFVLATAAFIAFHASARAFKTGKGKDANLVAEKISVETSLSERQTVLSPWWLLLYLPGLLATYAVALLGYPAMPEKIPLHYSFTAADAWGVKSWPAVLMPVFIGTCVTVLLFVGTLFTRRAPASVRGNPDAAPKAFLFRKYMIFMMIVIGILQEITTLVIEIGFLMSISPILFLISTGLCLLFTISMFWIYFRFVRVKEPAGPILDDDEKWVLGIFYYNRSDPSTFIEKRMGIGYTLNFARPLAWVLLLGILLFVGLTLFFSFHAPHSH